MTSLLLQQFKATAGRKDWKKAYLECSGLSMYEMLRGLDSLDLTILKGMRDQIFAYPEIGAAVIARLLYALDAVQLWKLTAPAPGDLTATGQVTDAVNFIKEKKNYRIGPRLGNDGIIPPPFIPTLKQAMDEAWTLNDNADFLDAYRSVLTGLTGIPYKADVYTIQLNRMVINFADTTKDERIRQAIKQDEEESKVRVVGGQAPAFSISRGTNIWIRQFALAGGSVRANVANIFHESLHLAGALNDPITETAIEAVHQKAGYQR